MEVIQNAVAQNLMAMFPSRPPELILQCVTHPRNCYEPVTEDGLLNRCVDDLLSRGDDKEDDDGAQSVEEEVMVIPDFQDMEDLLGNLGNESDKGTSGGMLIDLTKGNGSDAYSPKARIDDKTFQTEDVQQGNKADVVWIDSPYHSVPKSSSSANQPHELDAVKVKNSLNSRHWSTPTTQSQFIGSSSVSSSTAPKFDTASTSVAAPGRLTASGTPASYPSGQKSQVSTPYTLSQSLVMDPVVTKAATTTSMTNADENGEGRRLLQASNPDSSVVSTPTPLQSGNEKTARSTASRDNGYNSLGYGKSLLGFSSVSRPMQSGTTSSLLPSPVAMRNACNRAQNNSATRGRLIPATLSRAPSNGERDSAMGKVVKSEATVSTASTLSHTPSSSFVNPFLNQRTAPATAVTPSLSGSSVANVTLSTSSSATQQKGHSVAKTTIARSSLQNGANLTLPFHPSVPTLGRTPSITGGSGPTLGRTPSTPMGSAQTAVIERTLGRAPALKPAVLTLANSNQNLFSNTRVGLQQQREVPMHATAKSNPAPRTATASSRPGAINAARNTGILLQGSSSLAGSLQNPRALQVTRAPVSIAGLQVTPAAPTVGQKPRDLFGVNQRPAAHSALRPQVPALQRPAIPPMTQGQGNARGAPPPAPLVYPPVPARPAPFAPNVLAGPPPFMPPQPWNLNGPGFLGPPPPRVPNPGPAVAVAQGPGAYPYFNNAPEGNLTEPLADEEEMTIMSLQLAEVLKLFPNAQEGFVRNKLKEFKHTNDPVNYACNYLLENPDFPKKSHTKPADKQEEKEVDYLKIWKTRGRIENFHLYSSQGLNLLSNDFTKISKTSLRLVMQSLFNFCYAKTRKALDDAIKADPNAQAMMQDNSRGTFFHVSGENGRKVEVRLLRKPRPPVHFLSTLHPELQKEVDFIKKLMKNEDEKSDYQVALRLNEDQYEKEGQMIECGCCYMEVTFENMVQCLEGHLFCRTCLQSYTKEAVFGQGKATLSCLEDGCDSVFPRSQLEKTLSSEILAKYDERVVEESIQLADVDNLLRCPNCNYAAVLDADHKIFSCPECHEETCRDCKEPWKDHFGLACDEVKKQSKLRLTYHERMTEAKVRTCYKCGTKFTKDQGCNKMTCRCGAKMCYICRQPIKDYSHFDNTAQQPRPGVKWVPRPGEKCRLWTNAEEDDDRAVHEIEMEMKEEERKLRLKSSTSADAKRATDGEDTEGNEAKRARTS